MNYLLEIVGLIRDALDKDRLPDEPVDGLLRIYAVLVLAVGPSLTAEDVHNCWVAWMLDKDPAHPALVPFAQLDGETAQQDEPFVRALRLVAEDLIVVAEGTTSD